MSRLNFTSPKPAKGSLRQQVLEAEKRGQQAPKTPRGQPQTETIYRVGNSFLKTWFYHYCDFTDKTTKEYYLAIDFLESFIEEQTKKYQAIKPLDNPNNTVNVGMKLTYAQEILANLKSDYPDEDVIKAFLISLDA